ncbi:uncharacterized protein LOC110030227 [Phalaenopsis equestris]|uniref:uncharacterized protein LOC110030227 n=1 Tax=Phalaenopsis equestris TaxID=78828 RepID=UPI0009E1D5C8|nr:uncharacterized protein LOC110030227 [Phalaenopsis equestris]
MELYLESPLEALVLRYSSILAGYIWTCLALFAAGIGLWRFRSLGSASQSVPSPSRDPKSPSSVVSPAIPPPMQRSAPIEPLIAVTDWGVHEESGSLTKGNFTAYFLAEEIDGGDEGEKYERRSYWTGNGEGFSDILDWEWRGDHRGYSFQDWRVINGNIVRLWDGGRLGLHRRRL